MYVYALFSVISATFILLGLKKGTLYNFISIVLSCCALFFALANFEGLFLDYFCIFGLLIPIWGNGVIIGIKHTQKQEKKYENKNISDQP